MNGTTLTLLGAGLFLAWILGPAIVLVYRCAIIPLRYEEIRERFLTNNPTEQLMPQNERAKSGAWHYARLLDPDADPANPEEIVQRQFWKFHGWSRYWLPLILVIVLSGIMLAFSGLWISNRLDPSPSAVDNHTNAPALTVDRGAKPAKSSGEGGANHQTLTSCLPCLCARSVDSADGVDGVDTVDGVDAFRPAMSCLQNNAAVLPTLVRCESKKSRQHRHAAAVRTSSGSCAALEMTQRHPIRVNPVNGVSGVNGVNALQRLWPKNMGYLEIGRKNQPKFSPCGTTVKITLDRYL